jgi:hypothetical protein
MLDNTQIGARVLSKGNAALPDDFRENLKSSIALTGWAL